MCWLLDLGQKGVLHDFAYESKKKGMNVPSSTLLIEPHRNLAPAQNGIDPSALLDSDHASLISKALGGVTVLQKGEHRSYQHQTGSSEEACKYPKSPTIYPWSR